MHPDQMPTDEHELAPSDRPVEPYSEINPPPHETIPESADVTFASIQGAVRATPPPIPARPAATVDDLINELGATASRELSTAHRNRIAVLHLTSGFGSSVNHFHAALGELKPEDVAQYRGMLTALSEALRMARGRLDLLIDASAPKQAAE